MTDRVHLTDTASVDIDAAYEWIAARAPQAAIKWFNGLQEVIESLERLPRRSGVARESDKASEEIRQILYGHRPHIYRVLFVVRGKEVHVLHVRHGARAAMSPDDLRLPPQE